MENYIADTTCIDIARTMALTASASLTAILHTAEEECDGWQEIQLGMFLILILKGVFTNNKHFKRFFLKKQDIEKLCQIRRDML